MLVKPKTTLPEFMKFIFTIYLLYPLCIFLFTGNAKCQVIDDFSTDLPLIIIDTEGKTIVDEPKITAKMKIVSNENGINRPNDTANDFEGLVGIEIRGSSSKRYPQRPYLFETRDLNGLNQDWLFGNYVPNQSTVTTLHQANYHTPF